MLKWDKFKLLSILWLHWGTSDESRENFQTSCSNKVQEMKKKQENFKFLFILQFSSPIKSQLPYPIMFILNLLIFIWDKKISLKFPLHENGKFRENLWNQYFRFDILLFFLLSLSFSIFVSYGFQVIFCSICFLIFWKGTWKITIAIG